MKKALRKFEEGWSVKDGPLDGDESDFFCGYREMSEEEIEALRQDLVDTYRELQALRKAEQEAEAAGKAKKAAKPTKPAK
jgi:hypothetical protein